MPYRINGQCVQVKRDSGWKDLKCYDNKHDAVAYLRALEANVSDAKEQTKKDSMPSSAEDYAYVPDAKLSSTWKLPIDTPEHIAGAITALTTGFRGNKVEIPSDAKGKVVSRIRAAINKLADKDQKANLLDRLDKVKELSEKELTELKQKFMGLLDQTEVNYTPVSITPGKACSSCIWYRGNSCHIVAGYPELIVPNGYCDEHREATPLAPQNIEPIPVTIVEPPMSADDSAEMALPTTRRGLKELILDTFKALGQAPKDQAFTVFKAQDGEHYWISRHTGKFIDRESEIITNKAHDDYVARVQKGLVPMPELWTWHKKGTMHGQADFVWKSGGFTLGLGHFVGTPEQKKQAIEFYQKHGDKIKLSHMFKYPKRGKVGKVYHAYNTVEITTLPEGAEAFPYTSFQEFDMSLTTEQRDFIRGIGGDDMLKRVESADTKALSDTEKLEKQGVMSKGLDNFEGSTLPEDDEVKALEVATKDLDTRLKALETIPEHIAQLEKSNKSLTDQLAQALKAESDALAKANEVEKKLLEYQAVEPPASKSKDTLLDEREKSLFEQIGQQAKSDGSLSLLEKAFGSTPVVSG
jgi:hypothetical protein